MAAGLHISISAETLLTIGGIAITNSMLTSLIVSGLLIGFALMVRSQLKDTARPSGIQNFAEWIVESLHNLVHSVTGDLKKTRLFLPFVGTFLLWILLNNWLGLVPGVGTVGVLHEAESTEEHASIISQVQAAEVEVVEEHSEATEISNQQLEDAEHETEEGSNEKHTTFVPIFRPGTADLNTTLALAIVSVVVTQVFGVQALGLSYFKKFINFSDPIMFFVGILELISEFAKIVSFAFRLFGNIFAGEVLLVVIASLVPVVVPMPFYGLELFVGFIQALVFSLLSLVFYNMATQSHEDH